MYLSKLLLGRFTLLIDVISEVPLILARTRTENTPHVERIYCFAAIKANTSAAIVKLSFVVLLRTHRVDTTRFVSSR